MTSTTRPKEKAARDIQIGDWCAFASLAWKVTDVINDETMILIAWGNGTVSEFCADEMIRMHYDD